MNQNQELYREAYPERTWYDVWNFHAINPESTDRILLHNAWLMEGVCSLLEILSDYNKQYDELIIDGIAKFNDVFGEMAKVIEKEGHFSNSLRLVNLNPFNEEYQRAIDEFNEVLNNLPIKDIIKPQNSDQ